MSRLFCHDSSGLDRLSFVEGNGTWEGSSSLPPFGGFRFPADGTSADMSPARPSARPPALRRWHQVQPAL